MSITVRGLLARVAIYRPDLDPEQCVWAIQEATRRACRYTHLAVETQTPVVLTDNTSCLTVTPSGSHDILRVEMVRICNIPTGAEYHGTWDANANNPVMDPAASGNNTYFYIVSTAGTTTVDGVSSWAIGDVIYSNGTKWSKYDLQGYYTIVPANKKATDEWRNTPQEPQNFPQQWAQEDNKVYFYARPKGDTAVEITLSYIPSGEIDTIPIPVEAEDTIVAGALSTVLLMPGQNQDKAIAQKFDVEFKKGLANLRAVGLLGYSGSPYYIAENFSGRQTRLTPFRSSGGWITE